MTSSTVPLFHPAPLTPAPDGIAAAIHAGDAEAAAWMYHRYASGIRFFLRRSNRKAHLDDAVLKVILAACRRIRCATDVTIDEVTSIVLECTKAEAALLESHHQWTSQIKPELNLRSRVELMNSLLSDLSAFERDLLLRSLLLNQTDAEISKDLGIPQRVIVEVRRRARGIYQRLAGEVN